MDESVNKNLADMLRASISEERVRAVAEKHIDTLVDRTISDALNVWSAVGKQLKASVEESLQVGDRLNLPSYGHVVAEMLSAQIKARVAEVVGGKLQEDMNALLKLAPKTAKLSELIAEVLDENDDPCERGSIYLDIEWKDDSSTVWVSIHPNEEPRSKYDADIRLLMRLEHAYGKEPRLENANAGLEPTRRGTIRAGSVSGSDLQKDARFGWGSKKRRDLGAWFGFEQKILSMYACGTVIELDEHSCVLTNADY